MRPFSLPQGFVTAKIAVLVEKFGLTLDEVSRLTDYQIQRVYFHRRDKDGVIKFPELPVEEETGDPIDIGLRCLEAGKGLMKPKDYEAARAKLLAKRAAKEG